MKAKHWIGIGAAAIAVAATTLALTLPRADAAERWHSGAAYVGTSSYKQWQYTKADYNFAMEAMTDGYEKLSVADFNRQLLDWKDEDAFHKGMERLDWLLDTYPSDQPNAAFIDTTLRASVQELSAHHYGGSCTRTGPAFWQSATREETEDVFGDRVPVMTADAYFTIDYRIADETKLTVGQRDAVFQAYDVAVQKLLDGKTQPQLKDRKTMETALRQELARLDREYSAETMTLTTTLGDYYVEDYRQNT